MTIARLLLSVMTSFTRTIIIMSFVQQGVGMSVPSVVVNGLSLFVTFFTMQDVFISAYNNGYRPLYNHNITYQQAIPRMVAPFREFMRRNVSEHELRFVQNIDMNLCQRIPTQPTEPWISEIADMKTLVPAFVLSEVKRGFECGFLLLPFLVIDVLVAAVLLSMGMMMVQPQSIALPLKIAFFIYIDGWLLASKAAVLAR